tara:strand:- start:6334 stop:7224 length:891 start_codon:yes stop_codon:yes gene_type:complete
MSFNISWPEIMALTSSFTYSFTLLSLRQGIRSASPLSGAIVTSSVVFLLTAIMCLINGSYLQVNMNAIFWFAIAGCVGQGLGQFLAFTGVERMGVSRASPIQASSPIWSVLLAVIFLRETPTLGVWIGAFCVFLGVALLSKSTEDDSSSGWSWFRGALVFPILASFCFGMMPVLTKFGYAYTLTPLLAINIAFGSASLLLISLYFTFRSRYQFHIDRRAVGWFSLAAITTGLSSLTFWTSLTLGDVSVLMPLSRLAPLWILLWSYLFLKHLEKITFRIVIGALLVVSGGFFILSFK